MTDLRILHLTRDFPPQHSGGLSTAVSGLARAQLRAGMSCVVLSFDDYRPSSKVVRDKAPQVTESEGIRVLRVTTDTALAPALELASASDCQVLHVHQEGLWELAKTVAAVLDAKILYSVHVLQSEQDRLRSTPSSKSSALQLQALREADALHLPSRCVAALLTEAHPELADKSVTIPLARQPMPNAPPASLPTLLESELASRTKPPIAYVGRFADMGGFQQFLEALPPLFAAQPELWAIAAGGLPGNPRGEARWRRRWQAIAGEQAGRLLMPGWLDELALSTLYARASVLVVPSWFETFGQVVLEGMSHGTPIVTTAAGALAELVDENSALVIETKSAQAIVDGVLEVLTHPEQAQRRAALAHRKAREGYLWSDRMPAFLALYKNLYG